MLPLMQNKESVCEVRTQDPENFDEEVLALISAWCSLPKVANLLQLIGCLKVRHLGFEEEMDLLWRAVGICIASKGGYANPYLLSKQFATKGSEPSHLFKLIRFATYGGEPKEAHRIPTFATSGGEGSDPKVSDSPLRVRFGEPSLPMVRYLW